MRWRGPPRPRRGATPRYCLCRYSSDKSRRTTWSAVLCCTQRGSRPSATLDAGSWHTVTNTGISGGVNQKYIHCEIGGESGNQSLIQRNNLKVPSCNSSTLTLIRVLLISIFSLCLESVHVYGAVVKFYSISASLNAKVIDTLLSTISKGISPICSVKSKRQITFAAGRLN